MARGQSGSMMSGGWRLVLRWLMWMKNSRRLESDRVLVGDRWMLPSEEDQELWYLCLDDDDLKVIGTSGWLPDVNWCGMLGIKISIFADFRKCWRYEGNRELMVVGCWRFTGSRELRCCVVIGNLWSWDVDGLHILGNYDVMMLTFGILTIYR